MPVSDLTDVESLRPSRQASSNRLPILLGQSVSLFGDYIAYFSLPWLVFDLTGAGTDLGFTAFSETIPVLLFGFVAGVLLDRLRLKGVLIAADLVRAGVFAGLAWAVAVDVVRPGLVFLAAFVFGSMTVFFDSGLQSLLPSAVTTSQLVDVNTRLSLARTVSFALGPAAAGVIIASGGGFVAAFTVNAATFLVSALALVWVKPLYERQRLSRHAGFGSAIQRGLRFLFREPHLKWATMGAAVANFVFAPLEAVLVKFVDEQLAASITVPSWLGWLSSDAAEVGLFIGVQAAIGSVIALAAPSLTRRVGLGKVYVIGLVMLGAGFGVVATMSSFWAVVPAGISIGGVSWVNIAFVTMRQRITPEAMIGRVTAASRTLSYLLIPVGAAFGGVGVDTIGLVEIYLIGATVTVAVAAALVFTPLWQRSVPEAPVADWQTAALRTMGIPTHPERR